MHFDTQNFVALVAPMALSVLGLIGLAYKAFKAPSAEQHQAQVDLTKQALDVLGQIAAAAAQSVKPDAPKDGGQ